MEYLRQLSLVNPDDLKSTSVSVVGVGATGSYVSMQLAMLGIGDTMHSTSKLRVWDGDTIAEHNICNQIYEPAQVGKPKVEALAELIKRKCGTNIETHNEMVTDQDIKSTYVFLLTDTMSSRREIFDKCLQFSFNTDLVIETRMGMDEGRVYAFNPNDASQVEQWKKTLYSDKDAEASVCGASSSIIPTAMAIASQAVHTFIHHFDVNYGANATEKNGRDVEVVNEVMVSYMPNDVMSRRFKAV